MLLREKGVHFFVDHPFRINGKIVWDGKYFLGERNFYTITGYEFIPTERHSCRNHSYRKKEQVYLYKRTLVLIKPNKIVNFRAFYSEWGKEQMS